MIKRISSTFLYKFTTVLANFLVVVITSKELGSEGRGETSLFMIDFVVILLFTSIVAGSAMAFYASKKDLFTISVIGYGWSLPTSIIGVLVMPILHPSTYSVWLFGTVFVQSLCTVHQMALMGKNALPSYNVSSIVQPVANLAYLGYCYYFKSDKSVEVFVEGFFWTTLLSYAISVYLTLPLYEGFRLVRFRESVRDMVRYGTGSHVSNIVQTITYRIGYYVLFWYGLSSAVGELSNGVALAEGTWIITHSLSIVLYSHVLTTDDEIHHRELTIRLVVLCFVLTFFSLLLLVVLPSDFYVLLFGKDFHDLHTFIWILFPGVLAMAVGSIFAHYFSAKGDYRINNIKSIVGLVIIVLGLFLLVPVWGKYGAVAATSLAYTISSCYLGYYYFTSTNTPIKVIFNSENLKMIWTKGLH